MLRLQGARSFGSCGKLFHLSFPNKVKLNEKITLIENNEIISDDAEIAKSFKCYFDKT